MEIVDVTYAPPRSSEKLVLCIGKFDGVHVGHQAIIRTAKEYVGKAQLAIMSF